MTEVLQLPTTAAAQAAQADEFGRLLTQPRRFAPADLMEGDSLDRIERIAERMAAGKMTVPEYLRGNPSDCMAIAMQAMLWGMDPFAVAQKTHIVSGRLCYEAQLVNAVVQASGAIRGTFSYEFRGDGVTLECRVGAVLRGQQEITWGEWLMAATVQVKNSPLWKVNPKQQLGYLQVKNWARAYCPGAILGIYTTDELEDVTPPAAAEHEQRAGPRRKSEAQAAAAPPAADVLAAAAPTQAAEAGTGTAAPPVPPASHGPAGSITANQIVYLRRKLQMVGLNEQSICDRFQISGIELLTAEQFDEVKAELLKMS